MIAIHAPPFFIKALHCHSSTAFSLRRLSLFPTPKLLYFHYPQVPARTLTAMAGPNSTSGDQTSDHVAGKWYSVPDLRLRDHRFTVPLDYSLNLGTSPKISVFAREIVAGINFDRILSIKIFKIFSFIETKFCSFVNLM